MVVDESGAEVHRVDAPHGIYAQVTPDGRIWSGFDDQMMGDRLQWDGVVCVDQLGEVRFRFNEDIERARSAPSIWNCDAINVVSDDDVWISYMDGGGGPVKTRYQSLVRLIDYKVVAIYPWQEVVGKSRAYPTSFAITSESMLFQPPARTIHSDVISETSPYSHLFLSSLISGVSAEYLPVNGEGRWIGTFESIGRESFLYLITNEKLYRVNAAELP